MKILITGASGFIGSFIADKGLELGYEVWAGVRGSSSRKYLSDSRIKFIELSLGDEKTLQQQLSSFATSFGKWDYVIHAAGATKCIDKEDFIRTNFDGTRILCDALISLNMVPRQFIYLSSLSVYGPVREQQPYTAIQASDTPMPNTAYGKSKLMAERYLSSLKEFPYVILRPTGVYGPREKDYFQMAVSIKQHVDFAVGYKPQIITFIYVKDLVKAIYLAIEKGVTQRAYFVSEPRGYNSRAFSDYIQHELGITHVLHIKAPLWVLKLVSLCAEYVARIMKKPSTLNSDKYNIMKQRNWLCDTTDIEKDLGFTADYDLERGTAETIKWYIDNRWL